MKLLPLFALAALLLTTSCNKGNMPEPCRTNTTCESAFENMPKPSKGTPKPTAKAPVDE